jgi:hypothetical protein
MFKGYRLDLEKKALRAVVDARSWEDAIAGFHGEQTRPFDQDRIIAKIKGASNTELRQVIRVNADYVRQAEQHLLYLRKIDAVQNELRGLFA